MGSPSILSPHGEGYCGRCQFVVGLNSFGRLAGHRRGTMAGRGGGGFCKGSLRRPWKRTPYACRKNVFRFTAPKIECPHCGQRTEVEHSVISGDRLKHHYPLDHWRFSWCAGSGLLVVRGVVRAAR